MQCLVVEVAGSARRRLGRRRPGRRCPRRHSVGGAERLGVGETEIGRPVAASLVEERFARRCARQAAAWSGRARQDSPGGGEKIDGAAALGVQTGVVGDQADMLGCRARQFFRLRGRPRPSARSGMTERFAAARAGAQVEAGARRPRERRTTAPKRLTLGHATVLYDLDINDIVERCCASRVVRVMCLCYI